MVVELGRTWGVRHKHLGFARLFVASSGSAAMHNRDGCARRQAPRRAKLRHGLSLHRGNRAVRRVDSTTMQEGDRASTRGGRDGLNSPRARLFVFQTSTENCEEYFVCGTGVKGNRLEGSGNQSTFEGAVTEWAKILRLPRTAAAGRHTKTRDRRAHHHESSCHRILFWIFDAVPFWLHTSLDFVAWLCCIPFKGNDPPQFSGTW